MIIIVMGLPGSGKSYFARLLAEKLNASYLSSDKVREMLHLKGRYNLEDKMFVYEWLANITEGLLEGKAIVVVDATFYLNSTRQLFLNLGQKHQVAVKFLVISAPISLIKKRLERPRADSEADFLAFKKIKAEFEQMSLPCLKLRSSSDNITHMLEEAVNYINVT
ncbi:AAA family ATPase [Arthrospiribacter ruber]|nr:ATP-binding protein [Arthrospiribacter ruber]